MVTKEFLDNLQQVCSGLEASRGTVNLFALLKMDEITNQWVVVVSASWVDELQFAQYFTEIRDLLIQHVGEEIHTIARISIFDLSNHFSELMIKQYKTGDEIKSDAQINGNLVHEGYILKSIAATA